MYGEVIDADLARKLEQEKNAIVVLNPDVPSCTLFRLYLGELERLGIMNRIIVRAVLNEPDVNRLSLWMAAHLGGLFLDRLVYGLWLSCPDIPDRFYGVAFEPGYIAIGRSASREKTEFISCPGCGRRLI